MNKKTKSELRWLQNWNWFASSLPLTSLCQPLTSLYMFLCLYTNINGPQSIFGNFFLQPFTLSPSVSLSLSPSRSPSVSLLRISFISIFYFDSIHLSFVTSYLLHFWPNSARNLTLMVVSRWSLVSDDWSTGWLTVWLTSWLSGSLSRWLAD